MYINTHICIHTYRKSTDVHRYDIFLSLCEGHMFDLALLCLQLITKQSLWVCNQVQWQMGHRPVGGALLNFDVEVCISFVI